MISNIYIITRADGKYWSNKGGSKHYWGDEPKVYKKLKYALLATKRFVPDFIQKYDVRIEVFDISPKGEYKMLEDERWAYLF